MIKIAARGVLILILLLAVVSGGWEWAAAIQFQRGKDFMDAGDWYRAMAAFKSSARIFPRNPDAHRWLAKAYRNMTEGRNPDTQVQLLRNAEQELEKALAIEPRYPYYWFDLARISEFLEQLRAKPGKPALYCYRQAALIDPNNPVFLEYMAAYLLKNGKKEEAKDLLAKLLGIDVGSAIELGQVWLQNKYNPQELVECFDNNEKGLIKLSALLLSFQKVKAAMLAGEKAYQRDPRNPDAILNYGMVNSYSGDCERLKEIMGPIFKTPYYQGSARYYYATCLYNSAQYGPAEEEYLSLIGIRPEDTDSRFHLALIYLATNRQAKAREQLVWLASQAEVADPNIRARSYLELAKIFDKEHNSEQALNYYQLYLRFQPEDPAVKARVKGLSKIKSGDVIYSPWEMKK
jgi:Tfp pilus assembly protein PilF